MQNKVIGILVTLALAFGVLMTIYSQHAFADVKQGASAGTAGNGENGGKGAIGGGNGGICIRSNCNANGQNASGSNGQNSENASG